MRDKAVHHVYRVFILCHNACKNVFFMNIRNKPMKVYNSPVLMERLMSLAPGSVRVVTQWCPLLRRMTTKSNVVCITLQLLLMFLSIPVPHATAA